MPDPNPIEEALNKIEVEIRQLKIQYDMFFAGAAPRQPFETRKQLEIQIKTIGDTPMQRFADRYRYNSLAAKYQSFVELWGKMLRAKEEGRLRPGIPGFVQATRPAPPPGPAGSNGAGEVVFQSRVSDPSPGDASLRMFYDRFVQASAKRVSYDQFIRQIAAKTRSIKEKSGCDAVTYTIVRKGNGVSLKAVPARNKEGKK